MGMGEVFVAFIACGLLGFFLAVGISVMKACQAICDMRDVLTDIHEENSSGLHKN